MRTLVVGDIHSGLKALDQVLQRAEVTTNDKLVFLGDYVDGWSEAAETVDFLIELDKTHNCVFLRGNHDELCSDWLVKREDNPMWLQHGGAASAESYKKASQSTIDRHINFFNDLVNYHLDAENRLYLHAGFTNVKGVEHEYFQKTFYWDRTLWELALSLNPNLGKEDKFYPKRLLHYKEIYIGHTPVTRLGKTTPQQGANVWNIDTGAAFKGPLSIVDVDTKDVWQSNPVHTFYLDEKGRN
ncbi:metallophosphoesterase family protein [Maribacter sp. HTCC2170]|uniref:metallophosphoesterase family protein n=1 Tax=Maribacter sp. (strain HTCC2170 / KCCM 42371) TaxID=313603 RepID=UPI00006BD522|nr:metallophosphoesterase family protein [Maribacter sp. HTCC2170]EAR02974.1 serine/threonine protein phosphatase [Maribacter sp. HTCC2170]